MTGDRPHVEQTWTVQVKCKVTAIVTADTTVTAAEVAKWLDVPVSEVDADDAEAYAQEEATDESAFQLEDIESWDRTATTVLRTSKVRSTPPGWVPLVPDEHGHSTRQLRDECAAGRCHVDDRVEP